MVLSAMMMLNVTKVERLPNVNVEKVTKATDCRAEVMRN